MGTIIEPVKEATVVLALQAPHGRSPDVRIWDFPTFEGAKEALEAAVEAISKKYRGVRKA